MPARKGTINLLGENDLGHSPLGRIVVWAVTYGRYIMIGTEIVVLLAFISRFSLDRKLTDLKEEISQKQDIIQANVQFERDVRILQDKLAKVKTLTSQKTTALDVLMLFQQIVPQGVFFQAYDLSGSRVSVQAVAASTETFSQFMANLQASKILTGIDIGEVKRDQLKGIQFSFSAGVVGIAIK